MSSKAYAIYGSSKYGSGFDDGVGYWNVCIVFSKERAVELTNKLNQLVKFYASIGEKMRVEFDAQYRAEYPCPPAKNPDKPIPSEELKRADTDPSFGSRPGKEKRKQLQQAHIAACNEWRDTLNNLVAQRAKWDEQHETAKSVWMKEHGQVPDDFQEVVRLYEKQPPYRFSPSFKYGYEKIEVMV